MEPKITPHFLFCASRRLISSSNSRDFSSWFNDLRKDIRIAPVFQLGCRHRRASFPGKALRTSHNVPRILHQGDHRNKQKRGPSCHPYEFHAQAAVRNLKGLRRKSRLNRFLEWLYCTETTSRRTISGIHFFSDDNSFHQDRPLNSGLSSYRGDPCNLYS